MLAARLETRDVGAEAQPRSPRRQLHLSVASNLPGGEGAEVVVHNLSVTGLLIEADADLATGELIGVDLPGRKVVARVVWSGGSFHGCEFTEMISAATVSAALLLSPVSTPPAADEDEAERGSLSTGARIQIVIALALTLWALIAVAAFALF